MKSKIIIYLLLFFGGSAVFIHYNKMALFRGWYPLVHYQNLVSKNEVPITKTKQLALGNSQLLSAFNPNLINDIRSLAFPAASVIEYYFLLERYINNHGAPKELILSFFPYHFHIYYESFWQIHVKYGIHDFQNIKDIFLNSFVTNDFYMFKNNYGRFIDSIRFAFKYLAVKSNFIFEYLDNFELNIWRFKQNERHNIYRLNEMIEGNGYWPVKTPRKFDLDLLKRLKSQKGFSQKAIYPSLLMTVYMQKLKKLLIKYKVKTYIVFIPNPKIVERTLDEGPKSKYIDYIKSIYNKSEYFKFLEDIELADEHFSDLQHVSTKGSKVYTKLLLEQIQKSQLD